MESSTASLHISRTGFVVAKPESSACVQRCKPTVKEPGQQLIQQLFPLLKMHASFYPLQAGKALSSPEMALAHALRLPRQQLLDTA